jgi:mannose-6-phosphate isomerase-like protein (cupin superfamily)
MKTTRDHTTSYSTRDGSEIRELMHPDLHGNRNQSLAEATIRSGCVTRLHKHLCSEELYHVVSGSGRMRLGERVFPVATGDTICIAPGVAHQLENTKDQDLVILCCCVPPYSHADTQLL